MISCKHCIGCKDDFYNGKNDLGVTQCWGLETAELKTRYALDVNTPMNIRSAYKKEKRPSCYKRRGYVYLNDIPGYAK